MISTNSDPPQGPYAETLPYHSRSPSNFTSLFVLANFLDVTHSCGDLGTARTLAANITDNFYNISHGRILFSALVVGPYLIPRNITEGCNFREWNTALRAQLTEDLGQFNTLTILMPFAPGCSAGVAGAFEDCLLKNATTCWNAVTTCFPRTTMHELGHNLNLNHAGVDPEDDNIINSITDSKDIMSFTSPDWTPVNAPHMWQMGWLDNAKIVDAADMDFGIHGLNDLHWAETLDPQLFRFPNLTTFQGNDPLNKAYFISLVDGDLLLHHYLRRYQPCSGSGCLQLFQQGQLTGFIKSLQVGGNLKLPGGILEVVSIDVERATIHWTPQNYTSVIDPVTASFSSVVWIYILMGTLLFLLLLGGCYFYWRKRQSLDQQVRREIPGPEMVEIVVQ